MDRNRVGFPPGEVEVAEPVVGETHQGHRLRAAVHHFHLEAHQSAALRDRPPPRAESRRSPGASRRPGPPRPCRPGSPRGRRRRAGRPSACSGWVEVPPGTVAWKEQVNAAPPAIARAAPRARALADGLVDRRQEIAEHIVPQPLQGHRVRPSVDHLHREPDRPAALGHDPGFRPQSHRDQGKRVSDAHRGGVDPVLLALQGVAAGEPSPCWPARRPRRARNPRRCTCRRSRR